MIHYIYALIDPRTKYIRYVGQTVRPKARYDDHLYTKTNNYRANWIKQLKTLGLKPILEVLEICDESNWARRETWWIAYGRFLQWPLTNLTDGGEGTSGLVFTDEHKHKISEAQKGEKGNMWGKQHSEETKIKIGDSNKGISRNKGRKHAQAWKDYMRDKLSGANNSQYGVERKEEDKIKISKALASLTEDQVREIRTSNVDAKTIAKDCGISHWTIYNIRSGRTYKWVT